jgi:hypothetical protein
MKEVLAISAIALLFGITGAGAGERAMGANLVPVAKKNVPYYGKHRSTRTRYLRGRSRYVGGGPYPARRERGGGLTGPIPRSAHGG